MKILIIEDEHKIADSIKKGFEQEAHVVDVAYDGITGNDYALTENYDVIVLDIMLPDLNGITICKNIRHENINTPIIMLTARDQVDEIVAGLNTGADDYLTKPFVFEELLARVQALSRRPRDTIGDVFKCSNLELDTLRKEVKIREKGVKLSKKEYSLLEYLLKNKDRVLTKEEIIEHVWSFDADILPNTVEVYIRYLRNKIDKPFNTHLIKTVRGFGYKLSE